MPRISKELTFKPCPFCGKPAEIAIVDDEGNIHDEDYMKNPYSGLWFGIAHFSKNCPVSLDPRDRGLTNPYDAYYPVYKTKAQAIKAWNKRQLELDQYVRR